MKNRKGIILAGGSGTRLYPLTSGISKQLLPIYDKPMIYYSLSTLMIAGIRDILIISTPDDLVQYQRVLGTGDIWGIKLTYIEQPSPDGIAQAYTLSESFLDGHPSVLILGDNIFFGHGLTRILKNANEKSQGATIFGYHVNDPERYGVIVFNELGKVSSIIEKPKDLVSNYAITGLYFMDETASDKAKKLKPSKRGELEITSLLEQYLMDENLSVNKMGRGIAWLDTGTHNSLLEAGNFVKTITERQGLQVGSPDEVSYRNQWISIEQLSANQKKYGKNEYGEYLKLLIKDTKTYDQ